MDRKKVKQLLNSLIDNGGVGSGNWGHAGRPGKIGGSKSEETLKQDPAALAAKRKRAIEHKADFKKREIKGWEDIIYDTNDNDKAKKALKKSMAGYVALPPLSSPDYLTTALDLRENELNKLSYTKAIKFINKQLYDTVEKYRLNVRAIKVEDWAPNTCMAFATDFTLYINPDFCTPYGLDEVLEYFKYRGKHRFLHMLLIKVRLWLKLKQYKKQGNEKDFYKDTEVKQLKEVLKYKTYPRYAVNYGKSREGILAATINHELGHSLWNSYLHLRLRVRLSEPGDKYKILKEGRGQYKGEQYKELRKIYTRMSKKDEVAKKISIYATTNLNEFFAESFSMYCNEKERAKLPKDLRDFITKVVKERKCLW